MKRLCVLFAAVVLTAGMIGAPGCSSPAKLDVSAFPNPDVAALTADDVVVVMRQAGFSDAEIVDVGPDLRNALATSGSAHIRSQDKTEAIFAIERSYLYVASRRRGSFVYDLEQKLLLGQSAATP